MRRLALALLFSVLMLTPARAEIRIVNGDHGGIVIAYISKYWQWAAAGDTVRIEGACISACTIVLGIIDSDKVCATRNAEFGFHSASYGIGGPYADDGTRMMWSFYQGRAARVLARHGWKGPSYHPNLLLIDAQEIVRPCRWEDYHG